MQTHTETINKVEIEMVQVPAGTFLMGSPDGEENPEEQPQHEVTVSSFYMGKYQVTQAQWRAVAELPKVKIDLGLAPSGFKGDNLPVECVNWDEAIEFCDRLSQATGHTYRLPTEAEWQYAARALTTGSYAGNLDEMGWYANNSGIFHLDGAEIWRTDENIYNERIMQNRCQTHPVGTKQPNGFGLYDMHGNVWEWCMDFYSNDYYSQSPSVNPTGPETGEGRMYCGGCWYDRAEFCRSASRYGFWPDLRFPFVGFRIVMT